METSGCLLALAVSIVVLCPAQSLVPIKAPSPGRCVDPIDNACPSHTTTMQNGDDKDGALAYF